jgi:hypothetical protein
MTTLSPRKAIVYSHSPVPAQVIDLVLIIFNFSPLDTSSFPPTLINLTLQHFKGWVELINSTLSNSVDNL